MHSKEVQNGTKQFDRMKQYPPIAMEISVNIHRSPTISPGKPGIVHTRLRVRRPRRAPLCPVAGESLVVISY